MNYYKKTNTILILFGLIFISFFIFVSFTSYQKEKNEKKIIESYFANIDAFEILDSYKNKDSITPNVITYSKLKNFNEKDGYFNKNIDNSNSVTTYSKLKNSKKEKKITGKAKVTTYSKLGKNNENPYFSKTIDNSSSIKTYTELDSYKKNIIKEKKVAQKTIAKPITIKKEKKIISKEKKNINISNVTTYTKIKKKKIVKKFTPNVTTYTKIKKKNSIAKKEAKKQTIYNPKKDVLVYHNKELNNAENINKIEFSPVYPGCENKISERDKKSCLLTSVSKFSIKNFNTSIAKEIKLNKGIYETRVLFIIDKNGYSKAYKILGDWHPKIKKELKRIIRNLPKMKPGKTKNQTIDVKYSVKLPFIIK